MLIAIDPGNIETAFVIMDDQYRPLEFGKWDNDRVLGLIACSSVSCNSVVIEMIASYGMPVGEEVFETCVWIGRFVEAAGRVGMNVTRIKRNEVKMNMCHSAKAKDGNIIQALKDRFGDKGTKAAPGWFYGFKADCWQAYALGVTYIDKAQIERRGLG